MTARYVTDNEKAGQMRRSKDWRAKMKADGVSSRSFFVDERQHFVLDAAVQLMRGRPQNLSWWSTLSEANQDHITEGLAMLLLEFDTQGPAPKHRRGGDDHEPG